MFGSRERIWIIEDDGSRCGEILGSVMILRNKYRGSGTGTRQIDTGTPKQEFNSGKVVPVPLSPVSVPLNRKAPEAKWYRNHTNRYWYRYVIFARIENNSYSNARVHSSFNHHLEITMEKGIKAKGKGDKVVFLFYF